jgi:crotonobetainyl-CoA:carnitine CoA-transferase CaiB-like acyl-CoA transferase
VLGLTTDERGKPVIPGVQVADLAGGMIAAYGMIAALYARERTNRGQFVDVSMYDVMMAMLPIPAAQHFAGADIKVGYKYGLSGAYPFYNIYETRDGKYMTIGALEPKFWENFCQKAGREDLIARQFDAGPSRDELFREVSDIFSSRTQAEWVELMRDADCCCEPVLSLDEAFEHGQARAREMVREIEHPFAGKIKQLGFVPRLSDTPASVSRGAPALGEQTDQLLAELGLTRDERDQLYKAGIARKSEAGAEDSDSTKPDSPPLRV